MSKANYEGQSALIAGAGLVGSLWAAFLRRRGVKVNVYEARPDMRLETVDAGRSINLALSDRGFKALRAVGMEDQIRQIGIPMPGRMIHHLDGSTDFQPYGQEGQQIYSVSRAGLNMALMDAAEHLGAQFNFGSRCKSVDYKEATMTFTDGRCVKADMLFGADGAFSAVRSAMVKTDRFDYQQFYLSSGYKELSIPPDEDGGWRLHKHALHIWPRGHFMLIALPNLDGSFTCTLFAPFEGKDSFAEVPDQSSLKAWFGKVFPDAAAQMPTLSEDFFNNPTGSLVTIRCAPWHRGKALLLGDAAHAIVPFYGQGMNAGFEDCTVLDALMSEMGSWDEMASQFSRDRRPDADGIAELAIRNFREMRDRVGDQDFLLRKAVARKLEAADARRFTPVYGMVTFSHKPYSYALATDDAQEAFFAVVREKGWLHEDLDDAQIAELLDLWEREYRP